MDETNGGRRGFLGWMTLALGAITGAIPLLPGIGYLLAPAFRKSRPAEMIAAGKDTQFVAGKPVRVTLYGTRFDAWTRHDREKLGAVWVRREGDGQVTCLSTVCPHLGCAIDVDEARGGFKCPCHGSVFDASGHRVAGPSPRDMDRLETAVVAGELKVRFAQYRQGVADQVPL